MELEHYQTPLEDSDSWERWAGYFEPEDGFASIFDKPVFVAYRLEEGKVYFSASGPITSVNEFPRRMELGGLDDSETLDDFVSDLTEEDVNHHLLDYREEVLPWEEPSDSLDAAYKVMNAAGKAYLLID